ncbi:MAG: glycosyltransferase [Akkermansiaceae bacterium]
MKYLNRYRLVAWSVISLSIIVLCWIYGSVATTFSAAGIERVVLAAGVGVLGLLSVFVFPDFRSQKTTIALVILVCMGARLALIPSAGSDDVNRYLWEGKLTELGVNPYASTGDDEQYEPYRDKFWIQMNNKERPTAYPPLAMQVFRGINRFGYGEMSYKWVFLIADMAVIILLMILLNHYQSPLRWALFYGLSPLSLLSSAAEGHFDVVMVFAFTFALLAAVKKWAIPCGIAIGLAVGVKIMAAVVAPIILWRMGWKAMLAAALTLLLPLLFYWGDLSSVLNAIFLFGSGGAFNGSLHQLLRALLDSSTQASLIMAAVYMLIWILAFWVQLRGRLLTSLMIAFGGLLLLSPIVHFWYLSWVLPLVAIRPRLSWLTLSVSCSVYFMVWDELEKNGYWGLPLWARWAFWLPFILIFLAEQRGFLTSLKRRKINPLNEQVTGWSVVIPVYHPDPKELAAVLKCLENQSLPPEEVILVNAGGELPMIASHNVKVLNSEKGRGLQIKTGALHASSEWLIVLHSDVVLERDALERASLAISRGTNIVGGVFGQRFADSSPGLLLIESMNEFRATLMGVSFGDQTQFFHRKTAIENEVFTEQKLMEDVEMSDRMSRLGEMIYLADEGVVSAKKWRGGAFWVRFFTVIEFMLRYRLLYFSKDKRMALCDEFYARYYKGN